MSHPRHRAPTGPLNAALEAAERTLIPAAGAPTTEVIHSLNEWTRMGMVGRHAADPLASRVRNLVAFRSLTSDIEVPQ